jgi:hypothetical protein
VGEETVLRKVLLCPQRVRRVPRQFSWVDQRLVGDHHIERCDADALALYLFLVTVADAQGLSYYSEAVLARRLSMDGARLRKATDGLLRTGLIAYRPPFYQVLDLTPPPERPEPLSDSLKLAELRQRWEDMP